MKFWYFTRTSNV